MQDSIYYTYAWLREDKTPYYIGKGKGKRAWSLNRSGCSLPPSSDRVLILKKNLSEEEAFKHETYMISVLGRKNIGTGILRNLSDGGEGPSGATRPDLAVYNSTVKKGSRLPEEYRRKISEANKKRGVMPYMAENGKGNISKYHKRRLSNPDLDASHRAICRKNGQRMGAINGKRNKGKRHTPEVNSKKGLKGPKNPMYGKRWFTDGEKNVLLNPGEKPPEGYYRGITRSH